MINSANTRLRPARKQYLIGWNDPSPEPHIDVALVMRRSSFYQQIIHCCCRRYGVEGHIDDGGNAA